MIITKEARDSDKKKYRGLTYNQPQRWTSNYTQIERQRNEPGRVSGQGFQMQSRKTEWQFDCARLKKSATETEAPA